MGKENALRGTMLTVTRRYAAGIDVGEDAVRQAVVSRRLRANAALCVEHLESVPLPSGAVIGGDFVDRAAIVSALREAFDRLPASGTWRALRCAMGLPASAAARGCRCARQARRNGGRRTARRTFRIHRPRALCDRTSARRGRISSCAAGACCERRDGTEEAAMSAMPMNLAARKAGRARKRADQATDGRTRRRSNAASLKRRRRLRSRRKSRARTRSSSIRSTARTQACAAPTCCSGARSSRRAARWRFCRAAMMSTDSRRTRRSAPNGSGASCRAKSSSLATTDSPAS